MLRSRVRNRGGASGAPVPTYKLDFTGGGTLAPVIGSVAPTFARNSVATYFNSSGVLATASANEARIDYDPTSIRTNFIRNSTMTGAAVGTPGTVPTGWTLGTVVNITPQVVGLGVENGRAYIDLRFAGTPSGTPYNVVFTSNTDTRAANGQTWTWATGLRILDAPLALPTLTLRMNMRNAANVSLGQVDASVTPTTINQRFANTSTLNLADTAYVVPQLRIGTANGVPIDFTVRITAPQLELASAATAFIPTTNAAVSVADTCRGLLIEEARTNLVLQSADFNTSWTRDNCSATTGVPAPDGSTAGHTLAPTTAGSQNRLVRQNYTTATQGSYTVSLYVKKGTIASGGVALRLRDNTAANGVHANFNLQTMAVPTPAVTGGSWTAGTPTVEQIGGAGWYRLTMPVTTNTVYTSLSAECWLGSYSATADTTGTVILWGFQLEAGAFATSYIPTTTTTYQRVADACSLATSDLPSFSATEGSLLFAASLTQATGDGTSRVYGGAATTSTFNESIYAGRASSSAIVTVNVIDGGVAQFADNTVGSIAAGVASKTVLAWKANDFGGALDGGAPKTDGAGTIPTLDVMTIGSSPWNPGGNAICGHIKQLAYYPTRLTNEQLVRITK